MMCHHGGMAKPLPVVQPVPSAAACCAPLVAAPLTAEQATELAVRLKALADPTRLRLVSIMLASANLEACTCDLVDLVGLSQPTVSHHLKKLAAAGIVRAERRAGPWTFYRVETAALRDLGVVIGDLRDA